MNTSTSHTPLPRYQARHAAAMKDSWSHGDDRRERGRVDRGIPRPRRSRSPPTRRREGDRDSRARDRNIRDPRPFLEHDRSRERSQDRRSRLFRSPHRDTRNDVRERNRGRELLDARGSDKPTRSFRDSPSSGKRRKSRTPSPTRSHHKRSRRGTSRSPERGEEGFKATSTSDKKYRLLSPHPSRRRSPDRKSQDNRADHRSKHHRDSGVPEKRGRSPSPRLDRKASRQSSTAHQNINSKDSRSPQQSPARLPKPRTRSPLKRQERQRARSPTSGRRSPEFNRYELSPRSRQLSPGAPRGPKPPRGSSPQHERVGRPPRDEYRPGKSGKPKGKSGRSGPAVSGANSIEVSGDKMANRGFYGGHQGYSPHQQMQAAFPLKPQYQGGQVDPRQYSQSPQHRMTPNSYHSSPQAQSPYGAGNGNWNSQQRQQQYSPQP